jgi:hypothetical protein
MHPAAQLQFERMVGEYTRWRDVPGKERSLAPSWWWGPAIELRNVAQSLPAEQRAALGLPDHATYAEAARIFLKAFRGQTLAPWPYDFPSKFDIPEPTVRDLHPQPSDDSAFQP